MQLGVVTHNDPMSAMWEETLDELQRRADSLRAENWTIVSVPAAETTPEPSTVGETDRFGFVYVAPDDVAGPFRKAFQNGNFTDYEVFRQTANGTLFLVTIISDPESKIGVLLAGGVDTNKTDPLVEDIRRTGQMFSHVQLLDWTHLGTFKHDNPDPFVP